MTALHIGVIGYVSACMYAKRTKPHFAAGNKDINGLKPDQCEQLNQAFTKGTGLIDSLTGKDYNYGKQGIINPREYEKFIPAVLLIGLCSHCQGSNLKGQVGI